MVQLGKVVSSVPAATRPINNPIILDPKSMTIPSNAGLDWAGLGAKHIFHLD
jgi:hypothetical protein